jgi:serpin B
LKNKKLYGISLTCIIVIVIIIALFYSGLFLPPNNVQARAIDTYATTESVTSLSDAMNDFSFNIYQQIGSKTDENVFISPYSIFVALSMTYEGARGDTADQMENVLGFEQNNEVSLCSFGRIYNLLNIDAEYTLNTANALWTKKDYPFLEEYLGFIDNYYMGKAKDIDFTKPAEAAEIINKWVEVNTGGKIEDMLSSGDINPGTVLILSNAIYFRGSWLTQFNKDDTVDRDFIKSTGEIIQAPTMVLTNSEGTFNYTETEELQILELPYKGDDVSMVIILPKKNNITIAKQQINKENMSTWMGSMRPKNLDIYLPKFKFKTEYNLKNILIDMGLDIAFSSNADFSGMNGYGGLFIEKVLHKGFIEVNEEGSEAAAATTVHMLETAIPEPPKVFNADHPFIFLIRHKETGTILFMGTMENPIT